MKRVMIILVIGIVGCRSERKPVLEVDNANFKFDTCRSSEKIAHVFNLKNSGNAELVISKIHSACNCTVAFADTIVLKPSGKTGLKVEYDPALVGDSGYVLQKIVLRNNSDSTIVFLTLSGYVRK